MKWMATTLKDTRLSTGCRAGLRYGHQVVAAPQVSSTSQAVQKVQPKTQLRNTLSRTWLRKRTVGLLTGCHWG